MSRLMCRTEPCHFKANEIEAYLSKSVTLIEQLTLDTKGKEMLFTNKYSSTFQFAETLFIVKNQNNTELFKSKLVHLVPPKQPRIYID